MHKIYTVKVGSIQELDDLVNRFLGEREHIQVVTSNQSILDNGEIIYSIIYKEGRQPTRIGYLGQSQ